MAVTVIRDSPASIDEVWAVVTDFGAHGDHVPLTWIETDEGESRPGWGFTAYTGVGRVAMADHMAVTVWEPPRLARIVKLGPVLLGWAEIALEPLGADGADGTRVAWTEEITLAGTGELTRPLGDVGGRFMVSGALNGLLAGLGSDRSSERS